MFGCLVSAASLGIVAGVSHAQTTGGAAAPAGATPAAPAAPAAPPVVHGTPIADPTKTAPAAPAPALLTALIGPEVKMLTHPDAKAQATARQNLINGAVPLAGGQASPQYLDAYADALNAALLPLFQNQDLRLRLNAAIVLGKAAGLMSNNGLAPAAAAAVTDKAEPVVLWGVKAAKTIIPVQLALPPGVRNTKLLNGVVQAVRRFPGSGAIAEEAYDTLTSPAITARGALPRLRLEALPHVLTVVNTRIDHFRAVDQQALDAATAAGTDPPLPGAPGAEAGMLTFFSNVVWTQTTPTPAQKKEIGRAMMDLLNEAVRLAPNLPRRTGADPPDVPRRDDLESVIRQIGAAADVILRTQGVNSAPALTVNRLGPNSPGAAMTTAANGLQAAFAASGLLGPPRPTPAPAPGTPVTRPGGATAPSPGGTAGKAGANGSNK